MGARLRRPLVALSGAAVAVAGLAVPAAATPAFEVTIDSGGSGTVDGAGSYHPGEVVALDANPGAGQVWEGWTSSDLDWIGARVDSFTMPAEDVDLSTAFRARMAPLKDVWADDFSMGTIYAGPGSYEAGSATSDLIERNFNIITAENGMKPEALLPNANIDPVTGEFTFQFEAADTFVDSSLERGMDVHGHVLVWHSQSPARINTGTTGGTRDLARANMERYIQGVLEHFSGRVVTWDVVNEAFVDGLSDFDAETQDWEDYLRGGPNGGSSSWYTAYANGADEAAGESPADFIYDAFVLARQYGPEATLEYNDFNVFQSSGKGAAIVAMATELNERYAAEFPDSDRLLIETIGMQSHNYISQTPALSCSTSDRADLVDTRAEIWQAGACSDTESVERSIQQIVDAGMDVAISELDLFVWEAYNGQPEGDDVAGYRDLNDPTVADRISREGFTFWEGKIVNRAELEAIQAQRFAEYFSVYEAYSEDIERVTFWGTTDRSSWRATHNPLFLNQDFSEKLSALAVSDPEAWYDRVEGGEDDGEGIPITVTVPEDGPGEPGALSLSVADVGDGVALEQVDGLADRLGFTGTLPTVTVTDTRDAEQAGDGGWAVTGRSTAFSGPVELGAEHLGWTPTVLQGDAEAGGAVPTVLSGGPGLAEPATLAQAAGENRLGSSELSAEILLEVPVATEAGDYESQLVLSLFPVD